MTEYFLHFVGQGLYSPDTFEREARRYGVQRAVTFWTLKSLNWGDKILLARFINTSEKKPKKIGQAEVFGYFTLNGLTHNLPKELTQTLHSKLDVLGELSAQGTISRACGSYSISGAVTISDSLPQLIQKIEETLKEAQLNANTFKWFLYGEYEGLTPFILQPVTFARGLNPVDVEHLNLQAQKFETANLIWVRDYRQRTYMNKLMKERFLASSNNTFIDQFGGGWNGRNH